MLDFIRGLFKKEFQLANTANITGYLFQIIRLLEAEYTTDKNSKNAAIDAVCKLLQEYKDPQV
jgi:hypothetical protein